MSTIQYNESEPSKFLANNISLLSKGKVLDVAMGRGRNAIYLAGMGFEVEGVDISQESVDKALETASKSGVEIKGVVADLETSYHIRESAYDVIICFNYLQRSLIEDIKAGLRPAGMIVYETYIIDQARFQRPKNPDYLLKHNELLHMFRDFRCLRYHEGIIEDQRAVAGIIAEKTGAERS